MLFGDLTEGSYDFKGGSKVDVHSTSYPNVLSILKGEKWACVSLSEFILEHSTLIYIRSNNGFYHILFICK
jgi:hypothetical protein